MTRKFVTTALAVCCGLAPLFFGLNFLFNPAAPDGFGITPWPTGNADGYFMVKAGRDIAVAGVTFLLLGLGQRRVLGWAILINALIPAFDGLAVVTHGGDLTTALTVHGTALAFLVATAGLLLTERRETSVVVTPSLAPAH
ncbi:DUF4267 domain-containing protein [Nocardia camponoti]|uniref:DUF4267 domain-containing protein n=1 Tax=Nocardia camponoti TaxID=1616106 RepID=A0A917V703_9NOCA|nr:DUF4267 domain-containing protein [Nocardia camponoti]GGK45224.1 hypothetical protein GCM10011591_16030 [Nocardia camponoti]